MNEQDQFMAGDESNALANVVADDLARRHWDQLIAASAEQRGAFAVEDQILCLPPLKVFSDDKLWVGAAAWKVLYGTLAALAGLGEVVRVAPHFAEHLRAAGECLLPFIEANAKKEREAEEREGINPQSGAAVSQRLALAAQASPVPGRSLLDIMDALRIKAAP